MDARGDRKWESCLKEQGSDGRPNGCRGRIIGFEAGRKGLWFAPLVEWEDGTVTSVPPVSTQASRGLLLRLQTPLRLSWSMTVHKAQGMSIEDLRVDMKDIFAAGQAYVALSRATSPESLELRGFTDEMVWASRAVIEFYHEHVRHLDGSPAVPPQLLAQRQLPRATSASRSDAPIVSAPAQIAPGFSFGKRARFDF